ncbi:putative GTPase [Methanomethylovorans hollandica DSM 15978]|uniref:Probable GTP-binding protein EngB n=1 Tax=Methanomethylovorans hollandica (strain DSM 15978 / NBRC 107637 / DMS1) TaxID=867904 RepID=L0KW47_METHD|nr:GTP-binding protein EngB [Methanomethylovorans hollandica]AGB49341.1 putative GTPase [Methanomethylovorans hollandica DSM 15978]
MKNKPDLAYGAEFEILFVGRSNVGKSSVIRKLTGSKVRVGKRPGVTLKPTHVRLGDLLVTDMPGFGFMHGVKERKQDIVKDQIVHYIEDNAERIDLAVLVVDGSSFLDIVTRWEERNEIPVDIELFKFLNEMEIPVILAINKVDKIEEAMVDHVLDAIVEKLGLPSPWNMWQEVVVPVSAKENDLKKLVSCIRQRMHLAKRDDLFRYVH